MSITILRYSYCFINYNLITKINKLKQDDKNKIESEEKINIDPDKAFYMIISHLYSPVDKLYLKKSSDEIFHCMF